MAIAIQVLPLFLLIFFVFSSSFVSRSFSQSVPQNIQVFYPFRLPPPPPPLPPAPSPPLLPPPPPPLVDTDTPTLTPTPVTTNTPPSKSSNKTVATAVAATAASTLVLSALFFLLLVRYKRYKKEKKEPDLHTVNNNRISHDPDVLMRDQFTRFEGVKGIIVDEEGLDVLYWKNLDDDDGNKKAIFKKGQPRIHPNEEAKVMSIDHDEITSNQFNVQIQEVPLLRGKSSGSHVWPANDEIKSQNNAPPVMKQEIMMRSQLSSHSTPPPPPTPPETPPPPPPPPPAAAVARKSHVPPPLLLPKSGGLTSSSIPAPSGQVKLKPLHWDKVNANTGEPTAWDKLDKGSFRFNGDLMEALFGTVAVNKKSPRSNGAPTPRNDLKSPGPPSQRFILDTRKSQNIAIIIRSLVVSRRDIIDCLMDGKGLDTDTLEKLTRITPTKEEEELIRNYDHDITRLADAESFLYHILRAVPSAFTRFNAMFFKLNYTSEVSQIKKTLLTLETACKELKTRGLFVKLLEAILKAGNRMNAGTSRGNAQAFNLNSLLKLSDVKSSDGKTTLLHFVVEEVVRLEGKRCMINRNHSLRNSTVGLASDESRGKDYIMLGLPIVGGVSAEYTNVKKAAGIDYDSLSKSCSGLSDRLAEIKRTLERCGNDGGGRGFVREMEKFVEGAEREIQVLKNEEERIIGLVKITNEYYQVGASNDKGKKQFQMFVIVKSFLEMVDKACVDIAIKLQKKRPNGGQETTPVLPPMPTSPNRPSVKFPVLPANFMSSSSSDSEDDL
uniref:Formin-like protein n=1 Tax=Tanacetum cinerariifolium TaxID=118510 RepID=A0A699HZN0_TANCI|nr:formin-like protein 4 [Tanacetum cinerariifolium]